MHCIKLKLIFYPSTLWCILGYILTYLFFLIFQDCIKPVCLQHYTSTAKERRGNKTFLPAPFAKLTWIKIKHCGTSKQPWLLNPGALTYHLNSGVTACVSNHVWALWNLRGGKKWSQTPLFLCQLKMLWFPGWEPVGQYLHGVCFSFSTINRWFAAIHADEGKFLPAHCPKSCPRHQPRLLDA